MTFRPSQWPALDGLHGMPAKEGSAVSLAPRRRRYDPGEVSGVAYRGAGRLGATADGVEPVLQSPADARFRFRDLRQRRCALGGAIGTASRQVIARKGEVKLSR
jgi:hypothetical protein